MQGADDDVKADPNNNQEPCPIEAVEHKNTAKNHEHPGDVDEPVSLELGNALSGGGINGGQQANKKRDDAKSYEYPTDDCD